MLHDPAPTNQLLHFVVRRWHILLLAALAAGGGAFVYAGRYGAQTWTCSTTLLYNRSSLGAPQYQQPEVQSILGLFRSRTVLEQLAHEFQLPPFVKPLADSITAEVLVGSNSVLLTMKGSDPQRVQAMLDRLVQIVTAQAGKFRRDAAARLLIDDQKQLDEAKQYAAQIAAELQLFNRQNRIVTSVDDELEAIRDEIAGAERALETDRPAGLAAEDELLRRRGALHTQLDDEREKIARDAALTVKRSEFERAARLHAKRYISDTEFRRTESEYRTLEAQQAAALKQRQDQIAALDRELNQRLDRNGRPSAGGNDLDPREAETRARLQAFLAQRRADAERLNVLRTEAADLQRNLTAAQTEVQRIAVLVAGCEALRDTPYNDLVVLQPAAPALDPVTSNGKKLLVGGFAGLLAAFILPVVLFDIVAGLRKARLKTPPGAPVAPTVAQVPQIAAVGTTQASESQRPETIRTLALRIQQVPAARGAVVSLHDLGDDDLAVATAMETAECLHRRGEQVLVASLVADVAVDRLLRGQTNIETAASRQVVDDWFPGAALPTLNQAAREHAAAVAVMTETVPATAGLSDVLIDGELAWRDVVRRGPKFDVLPFGDAELPAEAFAARRLTLLLDEFRSRYSAVLLIGPGIERGVDLELLAARVDGMTFLADARRPVLPTAERTLSNLAAVRAPILGTVQL
jgi:capsular polysaccharide biosynthesis protein